MKNTEKPDVVSEEKPNLEDSHTAPELPDDVVEDTEVSPADGDTEEESIDTSEDPKEDETLSDEDGERSDKAEAGVVAEESSKKPGKFKRFFKGYWHHKKWTIPLTLLIIVAAIFAVPNTRYPLLALKMQRSFTVKVVDSKTNTPVSGASVTIAGKKVMTNSDGVARAQAKVGSRSIAISKQYYKGVSNGVFVGISTSHNDVTVKLAATGRQVPISVINTLTGKHIANAEITVLNTEAKTNASGVATIVLPTSAKTYAASITASGYNSTKAQITVTSKISNSNVFSVTPTGKVYFLSNLSGTIDVDSANLDGTDRQTVLAGTGSEDTRSTSLYQSSDWQYLALSSRRDGGNNNKLFVINTSNDQNTLINTSAATFNPIGWAGHDFVYEVISATLQVWQPGREAIKSYDADTGKTVTLDQSGAIGTSAASYLSDDYSVIQLVNGVVLYTKIWTVSDMGSDGNQNQILTVNPDGTDKAVLKNYPLTDVETIDQYIYSSTYNPDVIYLAVSNDTGTTYFVYQNGHLTQSNTITDATFYGQYPNYFTSPSGNNTFWTATRDGQNTLLVGDASGSNGKAIDSLTSYAAYGWYTDNYVLVSKTPSTLYIMPVGGGKATKIADYFQ